MTPTFLSALCSYKCAAFMNISTLTESSSYGTIKLNFIN